MEENNNKSKKDKKKIIIASSITILLLVLIVGITYAAFDFSFIGNRNVIETGDISIEFLESNDVITLTNALPTNDSNGKVQTNDFDFQVTTKASNGISLQYNLNIEKLAVDSGYTSLNDNQVKVYLTDENDNPLVGPTLISNLSNYSLYSKVNSHTGSITEIKDRYKIRVWIDENVDSSSWNESTKIQYKFRIGVNSNEIATLDTSEANMPILDEGMIAVYYDETSESWKKADSNNKNSRYKWYDYNEKMWANSVTVTSASRSTYQNASPGTEIAMDDILTMQVWIPRYKYKVWNYNADGTVTSEPQEIEIVFESGTSSTGDIECTDTISGTDGAKSESCKINNVECTDSTCNNKYYTHPAFTFGEEEIEGFWIGKFELTGTIDSITTKPNLSSLRGQSVSSFETNIMKMNDSGNQYGLSTTTDTHMIKNMEWGAVAYLSHSKYGVNKEIGINNNNEYITGCGASAGSSESATCNSYETELGKLASTTGNIYGVYDMSGGAMDYIMGNIVSSDGSTMMSGNSSSSNSGYTGIIYDGGNYTTYTGTYSYPEDKYYDKYSFGTSTSQRIRSKLGDAIKEVYNTSNYGWYSDNSNLAVYYGPWFNRGGVYAFGSNAGAFYSDNYYGSAHTGYSSHLVITP